VYAVFNIILTMNGGYYPVSALTHWSDMDAHCTLSEVRNEVLYIIYINVSFRGYLLFEKSLTCKNYVRGRRTSVRKLYEILHVITYGQHI